MRLFDTDGADAAYDRWLMPPDEQISGHDSHREENIFEKECEECEAEFCIKCNGTGYLIEDYECGCKQGRLW